jgi:oligopeptide transport system substrate-binding protein
VIRRRAPLLLLLLAGCGLPDGEHFGRVPDVRARGQHLRFCNTGEPEGLDPATTSSTTAMKPVYLLFDGLADYGMDGLPTPSLATRWDAAPDLRAFTFHLHDRGRFSNGRPITAEDIRYQAVRVLHPSTASVNAGLLAELKNAELYSSNAVRLVLRDAGGLVAGDVVEVLAVDGRPLADWRKARQAPPDSNERRATRGLALRDRGAGEADAYARVPAGEPVTVVEVSGDPRRLGADTWAYVHAARGDGVYGWVPWSELDVAPAAEARYRVRRVPRRQTPGVALAADELAAPEPPAPEVEVRGADLLMLPEVLGIRLPDPLTVVFETTDPTPWFTSLAPSRVLRAVPREAVSRSPRRWTDVATIVTSGPMHLVAWRERDRLEFVRSPTYWHQEVVRLDRLTMLAVDDQAAATNLYYTGGCDAVASNHVPASFTRALRDRYADFRIDPYLGIYYVLVQTERFPNRHLRRALAFAVDRSQLPKFLHNGQRPTAQFMPGTPIAELTEAQRARCGVDADHPGFAAMVSDELCYVPPPGLDFDPERARQELALARQELGDAFPARLVYKFNQGSEQHKLVAEFLQHQWEAVLGLDIQLEVQEWKTYLSDTRNGQFELGRFGWIGNYPDPEGEFLPLFACGSANNRSRYCSEAFEAALAKAKPMLDLRARLRQVREAERIVVEDAPVIPLLVYSQTRLVKPYVRDLAVNLPDQPPLHRAWLDPDWRSRREEAP